MPPSGALSLVNGNGAAAKTCPCNGKRKRDWYDWLMLGAAVIAAFWILERTTQGR